MGKPAWVCQAGNCYVPVFGAIVGDIYTWNKEWNQIAEPCETLEEAKKRGFEAQGSDDFNIAVVLGGRVVALLWTDYDTQEEPKVLDQVQECLNLSEGAG